MFVCSRNRVLQVASILFRYSNTTLDRQLQGKSNFISRAPSRRQSAEEIYIPALQNPFPQIFLSTLRYPEILSCRTVCRSRRLCQFSIPFNLSAPFPHSLTLSRAAYASPHSLSCLPARPSLASPSLSLPSISRSWAVSVRQRNTSKWPKRMWMAGTIRRRTEFFLIPVERPHSVLTLALPLLPEKSG